MRITINILPIVLCLSGLLSFSSCSQRKRDKADDPKTALSAKIDAFLKEQQAMGFGGAVLVAHRDEIILNKKFNDGEETQTAFWIGSLSKQFTAAAILKLQEKNKLSVNDTIGTFIDNVPSDKQEITIHHLLTHTSGLANNYTADGITNRDEAISTILASPLAHSVGEKYSYSAEGYNLLAIIIEIVSGTSFEGYSTENLLMPAGLNTTGFWGFEDKNTTKIAPYNRPEAMKSFAATIYNGVSVANYGYRGATGFFSTTQDLFKWVNALKNETILNRMSLEQLFQPYSRVRGDAANGVSYAYGWFIEYKDGRHTETRHAGAEDGGVGHNGIVRLYNNDNMVIVLSNTGIYTGEGKYSGVEWSIVVSVGIQRIIEEEEANNTDKK